MLASEAAKALDVSPATISRICAGERRPSFELMQRIRSTLHWTLESQADALRESNARYGIEFRQRMDRRRFRASA